MDEHAAGLGILRPRLHARRPRHRVLVVRHRADRRTRHLRHDHRRPLRAGHRRADRPPRGDLARPARAHHAGPVRGVGARERVLELRRHQLVLGLDLDGGARVPRHRRSGTCATPCRRRARSAMCCACCSRSRSASRCSSGVLLDMPFRFLGVQGNIAQLGPDPGHLRHPQPARLRRRPRAHHVPHRVPHAVRAHRRLGRLRRARRAASPRSATPPPSSCSPSASALAVGALALVRHTRPERRLALQWTLGGLVVVGSDRRLCGAASDHRAGSAPGTDFSMRVNLWNEMVDYPALPTRCRAGAGSDRGTCASSRSTRSTTSCARATRPG